MPRKKALKVTVLDATLATLLSTQPGKIIFDYPVEKIWNPNGVSLQKRLTPAFKKQVNKVITSQNLEKYVVVADSQAPTRCVDGRIRKGWVSDPVLQAQSLGPKIAGGTAHAALAHRVVDVHNMRKELQFEQDIKYVIKRFKEVGIGFGGHIDDHAHAPNTGCGAVDNIDLILDRLQLPEPQEQLRGLTQLIMGPDYDAIQIKNEVIGRMLFLDALKPSYLPKENDNPDGDYLYKKIIVEVIRKESKASHEVVPALEGVHNEVAVVLNFAKDTTFDTDRLSADTDNEIQVFAWDIWEMYEEASLLYPYSMKDSVAIQTKAMESRMRYVTTRTLLGIATVMVLTDGSLQVVTVE